MSISETVVAQGVKPTGPLGWVMARAYQAMFVLFRWNYRELARLLDLRPEDVVLDVACGSGLFLDKYAAHVQRVAGLDHSEIQVQLARKRLHDRVNAGTAELVHGDTTSLPWKDNSFSAVTCNCVGCFAQPLSALKEMARVFRPDGRAVLVFDYVPDEEAANKIRRRGLSGWTEAELLKLMKDAGFSGVRLSRVKWAVFAEAGKQ